MNPLSTASRKQSDSAFSLIEVVLALAVSAIGLVAILGLLPQGLQASRDAADNTISATIVHDIFSTLRASPFLNATNVYSLGFTNEVNGVPSGPTDRAACPARVGTHRGGQPDVNFGSGRRMAHNMRLHREQQKRENEHRGLCSRLTFRDCPAVGFRARCSKPPLVGPV